MTVFSSHLQWSAHSFSDVANYFLHVFFNPCMDTAQQLIYNSTTFPERGKAQKFLKS